MDLIFRDSNLTSLLCDLGVDIKKNTLLDNYKGYLN